MHPPLTIWDDINGDAPNTNIRISGKDYFKLVYNNQHTPIKTIKNHTGGIDCLSAGKQQSTSLKTR